MTEKLLRAVYCSENRIDRSERKLVEAIDAILTQSQSNNQKCGITGALVFNRGVFGQVLEGSAEAIEETFERIQSDDRHGNVTVLDFSPLEERSFRDWSMGYVGTESILRDRVDCLPGVTNFDLRRLDGVEMFTLLRDVAMSNELTNSAH